MIVCLVLKNVKHVLENYVWLVVVVMLMSKPCLVIVFQKPKIQEPIENVMNQVVPNCLVKVLVKTVHQLLIVSPVYLVTSDYPYLNVLVDQDSQKILYYNVWSIVLMENMVFKINVTNVLTLVLNVMVLPQNV